MKLALVHKIRSHCLDTSISPLPSLQAHDHDMEKSPGKALATLAPRLVATFPLPRPCLARQFGTFGPTRFGFAN